MTRKPYNKNEFVGRNKEFTEILLQLNGSQKQLISIVGAPGTGKTWLLDHIRERLHPPDYWVLVLNKRISKRNERLSDLVQQAQKGYREIEPFNSQGAPIDKLVEQICVLNEGYPLPVLFIDGLEEMSRSERDWLEYQVLVPFLSRKCTRVILTRRNYRALSAFRLRRREHIISLDVFPGREAGQQLDHLTKELGINGTHLAALRQHLRPYQFEHPLLNECLLNRYVARQSIGRANQLNEKDIETCLKNLTTHLTLKETHLKTLAQVAAGEDPAGQNRQQEKIIQHLFECGLIQQVPGGPFRVVADGVDGLVLAWERMRESQEPQPQGRIAT